VKILGKVQKITPPLVILAVHHLLGPPYLLHDAGVSLIFVNVGSELMGVEIFHLYLYS